MTYPNDVCPKCGSDAWDIYNTDGGTPEDYYIEKCNCANCDHEWENYWIPKNNSQKKETK